MANQRTKLDRLPLCNLPTYTDTPASLLEGVRTIQNEFEDVLETIVRDVSPGDATFENTMAPMAIAEIQLSICGSRTGLLESASGDVDVRKAAGMAHRQVHGIYESWYSRQDIFERVQRVHRQLNDSNSQSEAKALTEKWYQFFLNEGCLLGPDDRNRLYQINERLNSNRSDFRRVLNEAEDCVWLTREELSGLSTSVIDSLERETGVGNGTQRYRLSLKSSMVKTALAQIHDGSTRQVVFKASEKSVAAALTPFAEVLRARYQKARLMGFRSWAERSLAQKMAGNPQHVATFLTSLREKLSPLGKKELLHLRELKRKQLGTLSSHEQVHSDYYLWDQPYYHQQHLMQSHQLDNQTISEYFPAEPILDGMLRIFEDIFSLSFTEVDKTNEPRAIVWHPDVKVFLVWERNAQTEDGFIGFLYVDLYARVGKYSTCANFSVHPGFTDTQGKRHPCATALLTNFPPPAPGKPTLLMHSNVVQMFHELGHAMHDLLSLTQYAGLHGHRVPLDFVEMPSQMLENWCWLPDQLRSFSLHYSRINSEYAEQWILDHGTKNLPPAKLPEDIAAALAASRTVDMALSTLRQIVFAEFDMFAHGDQEITEEELKQWWYKNREEIGLIPESEVIATDLGHGFATTIHYMEGSASNYYSYLFSQVYSSDIFHSAFKRNPRNQEVGERYRRLVLQPGGSRDPMEMIKAFLGRDPIQDAFLNDIGLM